MKEFNCGVAYFLTMTCFLGSIAIFTISFYYPESIFYYLKNKNKYLYANITRYGNADCQFYSGNHPLNISIKNNSRIEDFNYSIFLNKYGNELGFPNEEKNIVKVKPNILDYFNIAIFINFLSIYLCFYLFTSFFIEKNECEGVGHCCIYVLCCEWCTCNCYLNSSSNSNSNHRNNHNYGDCDCNCDNCDCKCSDCNCDCKCDGGNGEGGAGLLLVGLIVLAVIIVIALLVGLTYGIYFFTKACGKNLSRYIILTIVSFINIAIFILCCLLLKNKELLIYIVMAISGTIFLLNTLTMILNNVCQKMESKIYITMPLKDSMNEEGRNATAGGYIENCPEAPFYESSSETPSQKNGQTIN